MNIIKVTIIKATIIKAIVIKATMIKAAMIKAKAMVVGTGKMKVQVGNSSCGGGPKS